MMSPNSLPNKELTPPKSFVKKVPEDVRQKGLQAIQEGRVAALISAGGQGTRLGIQGPKGAAKVLGGKSLFALLCEKILAVQVEKPLQVAIMTSPQNDAQTRDFFQEHHHFGLDPSQIHFFIQNELPLMSEAGSLFTDVKGDTVTAPNGNGEALQLLYQRGIWEKWRSQGIQYVNVLPVDNALAQPLDSEIIGLQIEKEVDLSLKAVVKRDESEKLGLFAERRGKLSVLEYSEYSCDEWVVGNTGLFSVTMEFIERVHAAELPLHVAKKKIEGCEVRKLEKFNFDLFPYAKSYIGVIADRKTCFSPLKNATGQDSFSTVAVDLKQTIP